MTRAHSTPTPSPEPPVDPGLKRVLAGARMPPIPRNFAARLQARVDDGEGSRDAETWLTHLGLGTLTVAGLVYVLPQLGDVLPELSRGLQASIGTESLPWLGLAACAALAAWGVDRLCRLHWGDSLN